MTLTGDARRLWERRYYQMIKARGLCPQCRKVEPAEGKVCCQPCIDRCCRRKRAKG